MTTQMPRNGFFTRMIEARQRKADSIVAEIISNMDADHRAALKNARSLGDL